MNQPTCPLCGGTKRMRRPLKLYGTPVCKKCYYRFASRRQFAFLIDWLLWLPISVGGGQAVDLGLSTAGMSATTRGGTAFALFWIVLPLIFFCKDGFGGHSPGKFLMGVKVIDRKSYEPIGVAASLKRNLPLLVPFMWLVVAYLLQDGRRLGDGWANSKVIWKKYAHHPVFTGLSACENCQYDLTANLTGVCPECGTEVSLANLARLGRAPDAPPTVPQIF